MSKHFLPAVLEQINSADDLKISPFRADGVTYGTPTWIWTVVVEGELYVRAYNGKSSRWYQSAIREKEGRIHAVGMVIDVLFAPVEDPGLNAAIDKAYSAKYKGSAYLPPMITAKTKAATIHIIKK